MVGEKGNKLINKIDHILQNVISDLKEIGKDAMGYRTSF